MPPRARANKDSSPIAGGFSLADNATKVDVPDLIGELPPPEKADTMPPVEKPDTRRTAGKLEKNLKDTYESLGVMVGFFDRYCGQTVVDNAPAMAQSMAEWAAEDKRVAEVLNKMLTVGAFGKVLAAHTPVLMAIGAHHVPAVRDKLFPIPTEPAPTQTVADDYGNPVDGAAAA